MEPTHMHDSGGRAPAHAGDGQAGSHAETLPGEGGWGGVAADFATDRPTFHMGWSKAMMWFFIAGDALIFGAFLAAYAAARVAAPGAWPDTGEIFALHLFGAEVPLLLIALMTFVLISSSGTMALAVNYAYRGDRRRTFQLVLATALLGALFLGMQVFEWVDLIGKGYRPWENPSGAVQFGSAFFMLTGFHGLHVSAGVAYLLTVARKARRGDYDSEEKREGVEVAGLYWHFVDLVWVFIFAFFYLI